MNKTKVHVNASAQLDRRIQCQNKTLFEFYWPITLSLRTGHWLWGWEGLNLPLQKGRMEKVLAMLKGRAW